MIVKGIDIDKGVEPLVTQVKIGVTQLDELPAKVRSTVETLVKQEQEKEKEKKHGNSKNAAKKVQVKRSTEKAGEKAG